MLFFAAVAVLVTYEPVRDYLYWAYKSSYYTHVVLMPFVSAYLVVRRRKVIFSNREYNVAEGSLFVCLGLLLFALVAAVESGLSKNDEHALTSTAAVLLIIGAFITVFGRRAFREAKIGLVMLIFMIPLPSLAEQWVIRVLQLGSAWFVEVLFSMTGVPVLREGVVFQLPGINIEVAPQCSGIRSSLALFITAVLAGHMYLKTTWSKVCLAVAVIPVTMLKNAIRIVTLSLLGVYVDRGFIESSLHRDGGIVFFVMALLIMAPILLFLRRGENRVGI